MCAHPHVGVNAVTIERLACKQGKVVHDYLAICKRTKCNLGFFMLNKLMSYWFVQIRNTGAKRTC